MGDPRKPKKKYKTPKKPWVKERIEEERKIVRSFGLKNKKEIMRANSEIKRIASHAKKLIRDRIKGSKQAPVEEKQLLERLFKLKLLEKDAQLENVLDLSLFDLLERRLQTIVLKKGFARSSKQARQFIVHGHIAVNGKKITVPSYLVSRELEEKLSYINSSSLFNEKHAERTKGEKKSKSKEEKVEEEKLGDEFKEVVKKEEKVEA